MTEKQGRAIILLLIIIAAFIMIESIGQRRASSHLSREVQNTKLVALAALAIAQSLRDAPEAFTANSSPLTPRYAEWLAPASPMG